MSLIWETSRRQVVFARLPKIMGILNVTPDSFSDGGTFFSITSAVDQALRMEDWGADIIDIGGESTRPYAEPVSQAVEIDRVFPIIERLSGRLQIPISIDTSKSDVAQASIEAGAEIINDVTGLEGDPRMLSVARDSRAAVCVMHMQGTPQTMQDAPVYKDVVTEIYLYLEKRLKQLIDAGISANRISLDPGIGFGKMHEHNFTLLQSVRKFTELGQPILIGHSRKGFIATLLGDKSADRTAGTLGVSMALARSGVHILRVHDVLQTRQALMLFEASGGLDS